MRIKCLNCGYVCHVDESDHNHYDACMCFGLVIMMEERDGKWMPSIGHLRGGKGYEVLDDEADKGWNEEGDE